MRHVPSAPASTIASRTRCRRFDKPTSFSYGTIRRKTGQGSTSLACRHPSSRQQQTWTSSRTRSPWPAFARSCPTMSAGSPYCSIRWRLAPSAELGSAAFVRHASASRTSATSTPMWPTMTRHRCEVFLAVRLASCGAKAALDRSGPCSVCRTRPHRFDASSCSRPLFAAVLLPRSA